MVLGGFILLPAYFLTKRLRQEPLCQAITETVEEVDDTLLKKWDNETSKY